MKRQPLSAIEFGWFTCDRTLRVRSVSQSLSGLNFDGRRLQDVVRLRGVAGLSRWQDLWNALEISSTGSLSEIPVQLVSDHPSFALSASVALNKATGDALVMLHTQNWERFTNWRRWIRRSHPNDLDDFLSGFCHELLDATSADRCYFVQKDLTCTGMAFRHPPSDWGPLRYPEGGPARQAIEAGRIQIVEDAFNLDEGSPFGPVGSVIAFPVTSDGTIEAGVGNVLVVEGVRRQQFDLSVQCLVEGCANLAAPVIWALSHWIESLVGAQLQAAFRGEAVTPRFAANWADSMRPLLRQQFFVFPNSSKHHSRRHSQLALLKPEEKLKDLRCFQARSQNKRRPVG